MKTNEAPEKIYFTQTENGKHYYTEGVPSERNHVEYIRKDAFIEKAKMFFKEQTEWVDIVGDYHWDEDFFKEFEKAMKL